jgi:hypothetical protein
MRTDKLLMPGNSNRRKDDGWLRGFFVMSGSRGTGALFIISLLLMAAGCEKPDGGAIDVGPYPPTLTNASLSPDTVNVDSLTPNNSVYTIRSAVSVQVGGKAVQVIAQLLQLNSSSTMMEIPLRDDGILPDLSSGDGIYSGSIEFEISRAEAGTYRVRFLAISSGGATSNIIDLALATTRANSPPFLDPLSLIAPDTITVPPGGISLLVMSIAASDSDGLADIQSVYFLSPDGDNPTFRFPMKDDGGTEPGPPSGDQIAGDGVFSILLSIADSPTIRGDYRFLFKAEDSFGDTSATVLHMITIN